MTPCPTCKGEQHTGEHIKRIEYHGGGHADVYRPCETCKGTGTADQRKETAE